MRFVSLRRAGAILAAGALALAACKGDTGGQGVPGEPGVSTGSITGRLQVAGGAAVPGATVTTAPLALSAVSAADGSFTIANVPLGTYSLTVSGTGVTGTTFTGVVVVAQTAMDIGTKVLAYSPISISFGAVPSPAGFGKDVALSATITGNTAAVTYAWSVVSGPTAGAFSDAAIASPTFTTGTFQEILDGGKVHFVRVPDRAGLLAMTSQQQADATYKLRLTVSDGSYSQSKDLSVSPSGWVQGKDNVGVGAMVIANDAPAATYAWTLDASGAPGSAAVLEAATTRNPWFRPDVAGTYVLTNGATSITVKADTFVGAAPTCGVCHAGATKTKVDGIWAEYATSAHANFYFADPTKPAKGIFAAGIDGEVSAYYSASCIKCHTTGYDPTATNGGFDESGFVFPATLQAGNFAALTAAQQKLGTISCESCHGPIASHTTTAANPPKAFFNAEACGMCHDALTHHDRFQLWSQSAHANLAIAEEEATTENRGTTAAHCGRCHAGQGFARWSDQLNTTGNTGNITQPDGSAADLAYLNSLGLNLANVQPQTCQTCHDPHSTRLRVDGSQPTPLPAGFTVAGSGAGQLCMSCHNTRNGLHDDGAGHAPTSFSAPHVAAQTDVYMGMNAYFVGIGTGADHLSRHAAVSETCVGCHMAKDGADPTLFLAPYTTNHSWRVGEAICANCHGAEVNGEALKARVEMGLEGVAAAGATALRALVNVPFTADGSFTVRAWDPVTDLYSSASSASSNVSVAELPAAASIGWSEIHGQIGVTMALATPVSVTWTDGSTTSVSTLYFQLGSLKTAGGVAIPTANSNLVKGMWNYFLLHSDGSRGIHNPSFALEVLATTQASIGL